MSPKAHLNKFARYSIFRRLTVGSSLGAFALAASLAACSGTGVSSPSPVVGTFGSQVQSATSQVSGAAAVSAATASAADPSRGRRRAALSSNSYEATVIGDNPLAYYRMDETSGTVLADSSGNGHPATLVGTVALGLPAIHAGDASSRSASFASGYALESATWSQQAVTAECWIQPTAADIVASPRLLGNAWTDHDGNGFMLWLSAGHVAFNTGFNSVVSPVAVKAGHTYHVAATFAATASEIQLYIDGNISARSTYGYVPIPQTGDSANTYIGVLDALSQFGFVDYFQGRMSDCAVYDHVLGGITIHNHYKVGVQSGATPSPAPTPTVPPTPGPITYNATTACVDGKVYTNNVLPSGEGEFATNGLDRTYWGGIKTRTVGVNAGTWGPGFMTSWGRHQYDTYFGDSSDGTGYDPFSVVTDNAVSGSPKALRIEAMPMPAPIATSLTVLANDQWPVTSATTSYAVPSEGGSLTVNVTNPNGAQNKWKVGMGYQGGAITFVGTLTSGGATPSGNGTGGSNPWTISNIHVYSGTPGTTVTPGSNDEGGFRAYNFPQYYSGTLDTNVNQQYGFFVARIRLPQPAPGLSPAWWMLETGGVGTNGGQLLRSEWDTEEQFAADDGYELNAGNILWNSGDSYGCGLNCSTTNNASAPGSTGVYPWPSTSTGNYAAAYHDYGVLIQPGGPAFPTNYSSGGNFVENNSPWVGTTFFVDGVPIAGHIGQPDLTQGSPDKEIMMMFQIGSPGSWLDPNNAMGSNSWPQYMYAQWLRAYQPSTTACS